MRVLGRIDIAGHGQHVGDIGLVGRLLVGIGVRQIVVGIRQTQARLTDLQGIEAGHLGIVIDAEIEEGRAETLGGPAHIAGHVVLGLNRGNGVEIRLQRLGVEAVAQVAVHGAAVQVSDLQFFAAEAGLAGQGRHDVFFAQFRQVGQLVEAAGTRFVGRNHQGLKRLAVGVDVEVVARLDRGIHAGDVETPAAVGFTELGHFGGIVTTDVGEKAVGGIGLRDVARTDLGHGSRVQGGRERKRQDKGGGQETGA